MNISPTTADKVIQHTLLSIQTVNKAGWGAATPCIWRTIRFRRNDDYHSFFAPIRRHLERTASVDRRARLQEAAPENRTQDLSRFFRSADWIRAIVFDSAPLSEIDGIDEVIRNIAFADDIAVQILERRHYIGQGVVLHLAGVCEMLGTGFWASRVEVLRRFVANSEPTELEVWTPPKNGLGIMKTFWGNVRIIHPTSSKTPSTIHNLLPRQWHDTLEGDLTVWLHPEWMGIDKIDGGIPKYSLASCIGEWLYKTICDESTRKDIPGNNVRSTLAIWGWAGCPCGCNPRSPLESDLEAMIKMIGHYAQRRSEEPWLDGMPGPMMEARIKAFFEEERLKFCWTPCAAYEESEGQKQE
jgi:hypothetical protein